MSYSIRRYRDSDDLERYRNCFEINSSPKRLDVLRWFHVENLVGQTYVSFAQADDGATAGLYAVFPVWFWCDGQVLPAAQSIDTLTDAGHRGKGLFVTLAQDVFAQARQQGLALVYGFPNNQSAPGFFSKLEWKRLGSPPFLLRPMRSRYFTSILAQKLKISDPLPDVPLATVRPPRLARDEQFREIDEFDESFSELWHRFANHRIRFAVHRDAAYLNWRFVAKPNQEYRRRALYRGTHLTGFVVYTVKQKHGGSIGYIMELVAEDIASGRRLLRSACADLAGERVDCVLAWCLPHCSMRSAYRRNLFIDLPDKLRPIELNFGVLTFDKLGPELYSPSNWYLSYADSDTM